MSRPALILEQFSPGPSKPATTNDIDLILDIPVQLTVELGRTTIKIKNLPQLAQGSVIELEGLAQIYDPQNAMQLPVVGQFLGLIAALAFLAANGHLGACRQLSRDTGRCADPRPNAWKTLASWGGNIMYAAPLLTLPLIAVLLTVNLALGVLSRAASQLNLFAVGFPVTLMIGFGALLASLPYFAPVLERLVENGTAAILNWVQ